MLHGKLEVRLVSAKGRENTDFLSGIDPYAILTCRTQEKKTCVVSGGSCPEWNETFLFTISDDVTELKIKLMDKDTSTEDDFIGEATVPLGPVLEEESVPPMSYFFFFGSSPVSYNVVKDQKYCGEIEVGLKFTHQRSRDGPFCSEEEEVGG